MFQPPKEGGFSIPLKQISLINVSMSSKSLLENIDASFKTRDGFGEAVPHGEIRYRIWTKWLYC